MYVYWYRGNSLHSHPCALNTYFEVWEPKSVKRETKPSADVSQKASEHLLFPVLKALDVWGEGFCAESWSPGEKERVGISRRRRDQWEARFLFPLFEFSWLCSAYRGSQRSLWIRPQSYLHAQLILQDPLVISLGTPACTGRRYRRYREASLQRDAARAHP